MRIPFGRCVTGLSLLALSATASLAEECSDPSKQAFMVRALQTELMVAALTCKIRPDYNTFVSRFKSSLVRNGKVLRSYYKLQFGVESEKHLNAYVTKLANKASQRTINARVDYCDQAKQLFAEVLVSEAGLLATIAADRPSANDSLPPRCKTAIDVATAN